jgi:hypothetical protein
MNLHPAAACLGLANRGAECSTTACLFSSLQFMQTEAADASVFFAGRFRILVYYLCCERIKFLVKKCSIGWLRINRCIYSCIKIRSRVCRPFESRKTDKKVADCVERDLFVRWCWR